MFALMPIIGKGIRDNPYRADVPSGITYHSAHIPTDRNGVPRHLEAITHFDDDLIVPPNIVTRLKSESTVRSMLALRDLRCEIKDMKRTPLLRDRQLYLGGGALAADSFDRADSADLGTQWDAGYPGNNSMQIVGNRVRGSVVSADNSESYNAATLPGNQWTQATLASVSTAAAKLATVLTRAAAPPTFSWYQFVLLAPGFGAATSEIGKRVAAAYTLLASETSTTWGAGDVIRGESDGTSHKIYRNGSTTALVSVTDSSLSSGRSGINIYVDGSLANIEIDDWSAGPSCGMRSLMGVGCGIRVLSAISLTQAQTRRGLFKTLAACVVGPKGKV